MTYYRLFNTTDASFINLWKPLDKKAEALLNLLKLKRYNERYTYYGYDCQDHTSRIKNIGVVIGELNG